MTLWKKHLLTTVAILPQALFGTLTLDVMVLTVLYSIAGLGIAIVNDFKSIEGDRCRIQKHAVTKDLNKYTFRVFRLCFTSMKRLSLNGPRLK